MLLLATKVWEQRQLGEIGTTYSGLSGKNKSDFEKGNSNFVTFLEVLNNPILKNIDLTNKVEIKENEHQNKVKRNDILFNTSSETPEEVATSTVVDVNQSNLYLNSFCFGFRPNVKFSNYYIGYYLRSNHFRNRVFCLAQGISRYNISKKSLIKLKLSLPKLEEQDKIGKIFNQVELLLTLYERKLKLLSQAKKYFLDNLFAEKEYPNLRFKEFTDAWEQRKLGKVATFINGRAYKQNELLDSGKYKVLRVGNFYTNDSWYYSNLELADKYYIDKGDLVYTWSATFGPHIWNGEKVIYHYHIWKIELSKFLDRYFTLQILEADKAKLLANTNGSTMIHVTKKGMESKVISLPTIEEQKQIGLYLTEFDTLIALYENKKQNLIEIKKSLLNTMFI